jgi:DNA repair exonuclease SbcCD ATPase subunit
MAITTPDIHAAADKIAAQGTTPTLAAVRSALGGGSFTTISEAMKEWKASQQASATPIREPAPAAIADRMAVAASETWAIALEMANDRMRSEREALDLARGEMEKAQAEAAELADQLAADLEGAQATIEQQRQTLASAETQAGQQAAKSAALVQQLAQQTDAAHSAAAALAEARARIEQLSGMFDQERTERIAGHAQERTERVAAQNRASAAEQSAAVLAARLEGAERAREQAQASAVEAEKLASAAEQSAAVLAARLEGAERAREQAQASAVEAEKLASAARRAEQSARIAEQAVQSRLEGAARELEASREQISEARGAAKKAGEEAAELRGRLAVKSQVEKTKKPA